MNKPTFPLSTRGSNIIDASLTPKHVRWVCVNYVASLETLLPEGLSYLTPEELAVTISRVGFNCVRLTWSIEMLQKGHMNAVGPGSAFARYASESALADIVRVNPWIAHATVLQCLERVIEALAKHDLMVIANNHVSKTAWCSHVDDGNRWFGDSCFPVDEWLAGLREMACIAKRHPNIVAIGLRNELLKLPIHHGLFHTDWVHHMSLGARAVHAENPSLLLVAGGNFAAGNLGFIRSHHFVPEIKDRVVFESHINNGGYVNPLWKRLGYNWTSKYLICLIENRNGFVKFLKHRPAPYLLGEFGVAAALSKLSLDDFRTAVLALAQRNITINSPMCASDSHLPIRKCLGTSNATASRDAPACIQGLAQDSDTQLLTMLKPHPLLRKRDNVSSHDNGNYTALQRANKKRATDLTIIAAIGDAFAFLFFMANPIT
ncbi:hypothetical protein WJX75_007532 [Coccomyxa subellipsoidea]|uniref:Glycoside hydrolase family 5 domain-containing protein n=1 Tax=Coccomyxa subellipsoidea TaxID=248742 RepID=A0ABR2YRY9_9CHLO